jgi:hypothetical protein
MHHHYVQLLYSSNFFMNVKKARNVCNNGGRETKEIEVVFRVYSYVFEHKKRKEIDYIKRNDFELNIVLGGHHRLHIT